VEFPLIIFGWHAGMTPAPQYKSSPPDQAAENGVGWTRILKKQLPEMESKTMGTCALQDDFLVYEGLPVKRNDRSSTVMQVYSIKYL
jgi:hypothetical protein